MADVRFHRDKFIPIVASTTFLFFASVASMLTLAGNDVIKVRHVNYFSFGKGGH